jgi:hypothetical protein
LELLKAIVTATGKPVRNTRTRRFGIRADSDAAAITRRCGTSR